MLKDNLPTGAELRAIRQAQGLSLKALGALLGVHYRTVGQWELGRRKASSLAQSRLREWLEELRYKG